MYHATMPTDSLIQVRAALIATKEFGFEKVC
jgi:aspartate aminotransferase-like enzyme